MKKIYFEKQDVEREVKKIVQEFAPMKLKKTQIAQIFTERFGDTVKSNYYRITRLDAKTFEL